MRTPRTLWERLQPLVRGEHKATTLERPGSRLIELMLLVTHLVLQEVRAEKKEGWKPIPAAAELGGSRTQPGLCVETHTGQAPLRRGTEIRGHTQQTTQHR